MKICYVANASSIHTKRWVRWFCDRGHKVVVLTDYQADIKGAETILIGNTGTLWSFIMRGLNTRKYIKKIKPDIVHAHFVFGYGTWATLAGFRPMLISPWGSDIARLPERTPLHKLMVKHVLKRADKVMCVDNSLVERVTHLIGPNPKVEKLEWGVDIDKFKPNKKIHNGVRILCLRKFQDPYMMDYMLHAIPIVLAKYPDAEFFLLRSGKDLDAAISYIQKANLNSNVTFVEERPNEELPELMNNCDIYAESGYNDIPGGGIGMTPLEAMACGLPIVFSDSAGVDIYITHMKNGYIYRGLDSEALARAIITLIEDPDLRNRMGEEARKYIVDHQDWNRNMERMESIYKGMLNEGR